MLREDYVRMNKNFETDCVIVGGGPAGKMTALLLLRNGVKVTVIEKHADFLRDFRGDTIHPSTQELLDELGLLNEFLARPHSDMERVTLSWHSTELVLADFSHPLVRLVVFLLWLAIVCIFPWGLLSLSASVTHSAARASI